MDKTDVESDEQAVGSKGKGKGKARSTGKDDGRNEGEDEGIDEYQAPTAEVNPLDSICGRALFTYARVNILDPPVDILFGEWNTRLPVDSKARDLAKSIIEQKFRPFASDSLLPLVIPKESIDARSIHRTPNIEDAPMLQLTEEARHSGMVLKFAGGRHRHMATKIIKSASEEKVKKYREEIEELRKKAEKAKEGSVAAENLGSKLRLREAQIEMEKELQGKIGIWGIALYEEGK